ncbi:hypothetical protein BURMUCGD1_6592 [Burkholderia multivorans CGD1]|nr:hypothetical protein BURMUCGD1_6592 [Burkholderia multivorans CGD1]
MRNGAPFRAPSALACADDQLLLRQAWHTVRDELSQWLWNKFRRKGWWQCKINES